MRGIIRYSLLSILVIAAYAYGVVSLRYNLFPIAEFREFRSEINTVSNLVLEQLGDNESYEFIVTKLSYYQLDDEGSLVIDDERSTQDAVFYEVEDRQYDFTRKFSKSDTVVLIMDAWADSGTEFLNAQYTPIYLEAILPLADAFSAHGFRQYAFTNEDTVAGYGEDLFSELEAMVDEGKLLKRYHSNGDIDSFESELRAAGIKNIIYLGFASNMCVIGRRVGMFGMYRRGFNTYFVPESSGAVETQDGWINGEFHQFTTSLIQHNFPGTLSMESIMDVLQVHAQ